MRGGGDAVGDGGAAAVTECGDRISGAEKPCLEAGDQSLLAIVVSAGDSVDCEEKGCVESPQKSHLSRNSSSQEQCRVCQQDKEEDLIELGCHCRGGLAKAHRTCIDTWFNTRGSNKCEICQRVTGYGGLTHLLEEQLLHQNGIGGVSAHFGLRSLSSLVVSYWIY